jgi:hypothetical protein
LIRSGITPGPIPTKALVAELVDALP